MSMECTTLRDHINLTFQPLITHISLKDEDNGIMPETATWMAWNRCRFIDDQNIVIIMYYTNMVICHCNLVSTMEIPKSMFEKVKYMLREELHAYIKIETDLSKSMFEKVKYMLREDLHAYIKIETDLSKTKWYMNNNCRHEITCQGEVLSTEFFLAGLLHK